MKRDSELKELLGATLGEDAGTPDVEQAWRRFAQRREREGDPARRIRPAWVALAAGVALVGALGVSPGVRSAAAAALEVFRIRNVTALPFDPSAAAPLANHEVAGMIQQMLSDEVHVSLSEKNQAVASARQASQLAGFGVRYAPTWDGQTAMFRVQGAKDFSLTIDRTRAQAILNEAGVVGVNLPLSLDGATIGVQIPRAAAVLYGDCAGAGNRRGPRAPAAKGNCTVLGESPSPVVALPPGLNMQEIAVVGLQFLGMSPDEAEQYVRTVDWTSTLVVPVPRGHASAQTVTVDGVQGLLLRPLQPRGRQSYMLIWSRHGMLYSIAGPGDGSQGMQLAGELTN
jgi:hypothetical protein